MSNDDVARSRVFEELAQQGFVIFSADELGLDVRDASRVPWDVAVQLFGRAPVMLERQPIRAIDGGRSFASSDGDCPLHTDSQMFGGRPPHVQVMVCEQHAQTGGDTLLVDAWTFAARLADTDRALYDALFDVVRTIPFMFGDVCAPTIALLAGDVVFTHAPFVVPHDPVSARLASALADAPVIRVRVTAGQVLLVDNHRMLHGRTGFTDHRRSFTRLLAWLDAPVSASSLLAARLRSRAGVHGDAAGAPHAVAEQHLHIVLAMLRGVPPGVLARRHQIAEAQLYRMRDAAMRGARDALRHVRG